MNAFKVLVVDDSPFMRKVVSDLIAADGAFRVVGTAKDGAEALERARELGPDLITMDLEMPAMNGLEALRRIMAERPTPVIMMSAVTDRGTRDTIRALQYGAIDFIRKPDGSVKLDIRQVGEQLLEKLHDAAEMAQSGAMRLPAPFEDPDEPVAAAEPATHERPPSAPSTAAPPPVPGPAKPKPTESRPPDRKPQGAASPAPKAGEPPAGTVAPPSPKPGAAPRAAAAGGTAQTGPAARKRPDEPGTPRPASRKASGAPVPPAVPAAESGLARTARPAKPPRAERPSSPAPAARTGGTEAAAAQVRSAAFTDVVAIGTSTGGPRALHEVIANLPADFPAPVLIVQHMPPKFTFSLAQRLASFAKIPVREARDGEPVRAGEAYLAPGGWHLSLAKDASGAYRIALSEEAPVSGHRPSVDVLFESLLAFPELRRHAVLMTGMGSDGAKGMKALRDGGAVSTIAEAEETCVVYGMPRSAIECGAAAQVAKLQQIAGLLAQQVSRRSPAGQRTDDQSGGVGQWK
ncbi:chemotaxis response regulator protein-glutamate methylesterase [Cohnella sp. REN36]|uniref:protein-glutamate methylesterase/protein-glutamine glutaminase n=1 Tax=Cohnella sp. REN36 TaxID=2887347 RepID=UPI001D15A218|nr:chemotaxis response regulator protein-glutamate methylesterase [Cohnella sp. REN36]MCC3376218.1 response regulator [Cohnella sp. REN36]